MRRWARIALHADRALLLANDRRWPADFDALVRFGHRLRHLPAAQHPVHRPDVTELLTALAEHGPRHGVLTERVR